MNDSHLKPLNWIQWVTLGLAVSVAFLAFSVLILFWRINNQSVQNHDVLCAQKAQADAAVAKGKDVLAHPNTAENAHLIKALGIKFIRSATIQNESRARTFRDASCS